MIGVDACQRSFCIAFAFLSGESEEDFSWALERLKSLYTISNTRLPSVILTDCCIACINAVGTWFLSSKLLLCLWHANKAVLQHCRPSFPAMQQVASDSFIANEWKEFNVFPERVDHPSEWITKTPKHHNSSFITTML